MYAKYLLVLLGVFLPQVWGAAISNDRDNELIEFLVKARALGADPGRFNECFDQYTKELTVKNGEYDVAYKRCLADADIALESVDNSTVGERQKMHADLNITCSAAQACQYTLVVVGQLNCLSETGKSSATDLNSIAGKANLLKTDLEGRYQAVAFDRDICTTVCLQKFNQDSELIYGNWERCIKGLPVLTTWPPATTEEASQEDSTTDDWWWYTAA